MCKESSMGVYCEVCGKSGLDRCKICQVLFDSLPNLMMAFYSIRSAEGPTPAYTGVRRSEHGPCIFFHGSNWKVEYYGPGGWGPSVTVETGVHLYGEFWICCYVVKEEGNDHSVEYGVPMPYPDDWEDDEQHEGWLHATYDHMENGAYEAYNAGLRDCSDCGDHQYSHALHVHLYECQACGKPAKECCCLTEEDEEEAYSERWDE
jgi:hypothetical protein